ncbi:DUF6115 domain-containing protein [Sporosarcina sp. YIM B06819]|uniref:DUF6115 domain-containing protein n=1 Tax=Sporosarcina sp. YIM B06819 TaxID=3081769 RepID=UPI00298D24CC|nr:hypothetical protein [Sporosarcina sp. YIM B06819]
MVWIALVVLFIVQIISFYFLALLYTKVSKFDDLEKKQRKLMVEMDDSIGAYLSELKDENERLIERLATRDQIPVMKKVDNIMPSAIKQEVDTVEQPQPVMRVSKPTVPINVALKSYNTVAVQQESPVEVDNDRTRAIKLHDAGQSIEEIAKALGKGRTEVELILKFK